ncbi:MAG TPA: transglycosylase SLT domain-containing protein [Gemmatimonadaceae bacterium]|nr:transglycosylase SLT domain-containing protein [Gemmatimonadaceae bacterium]
MKERKQVEHLYHSPWRGYLRTAVHAVALVVLLAAGTFWTVNQQHPKYAQPAGLLRLPATVISAARPHEDPFRIAQVLRRYTPNTDVANRIAKAVVSEGKKRKIDPTLLLGVMLVESSNLNPRARSFVGARGLMQVMPFHRGNFGCKSSDLYNIESNICHGVGVLAYNIKRAPNLRAALQRYNGCVTGSNTPGCESYSGKVMRTADRTARQIMMADTPPQH